MKICYFDFETLSLADVTVCGAYAYARHPETDILVLAGVFDDEPNGFIWSPAWAWGNANNTIADKFPERIMQHVREGGYVMAHNAAFDRHIWNEVGVKKYGFPPLPLKQVLCSQAQAEANNLPGKLEKAAETLGTSHKKDPKGTQLIRQLSANRRRADYDCGLNETPARMGHFRSYCLKDVLATRDIVTATRPLTAPEWEEYHASEEINDRGVAVDVEFAQAAQNYAEAEFADVNAEMYALTGDKALTVTNHPRKARWLYDNLYPAEELQEIVSRPPKKDKPDKPRFSADRPTRETIAELLAQPAYADLLEPDQLERVNKFLELVEAGNSAAVRKFAAINNQAYHGRVHGGYSFNGAGQTGRFSSRGIQVHNIINKPVEYGNPDRAVDAIEDIIAGRHPASLKHDYGYPVSRLLARLIRPTFIAPEGRILVWADWAQIEARVLPWLANSRGGEAKLDLFRQKQDVYKYAAVPIFMLDTIDEVDSEQRQVGKVAELALGFGGSIGAFSAMGRSYGLVLPEDQVSSIVQSWRSANQWCVSFWDELWQAALNAYNYPGEWYSAGRVRYLFHPQLMHGTLVCALPDDRLIVYPQFKREWVEYERDDGSTGKRMETTFVRGFGSGSARLSLWYGTLAENITQGTAASFLRQALVDLQDVAVLHTHDEIVLEVDEDQEDYWRREIEFCMTFIPDWADGLPLEVDVESGPFYSK